MVRRLIHMFLVPTRVRLSVWIIVNVHVYVHGSTVWMAVVLILAKQVAHGQYEQDDADCESLERQYHQPAQQGRHDTHLEHERQEQHQALARSAECARVCGHMFYLGSSETILK